MTYHPINSGFPYIFDHAVFKGLLGEKEEIRHMEQSNGYTVVSYIISGESTFDNSYAIECRGLVFDKAGKLAARPLHKFFNLNERPGARPEDFDWSKLTRVMDKRDGSMIHTVAVDEADSPFILGDEPPFDEAACTFTLKSKKSFESDVAVQARKWMQERQNFIDFCQHVTNQECTAIFEWTSPTARIVLPYKEDGLTLLHVRDNATGRYWTEAQLIAAEHHGVPIVKSDATSDIKADIIFVKMMKNRSSKNVWACVQELQETVENVEGWVFQFEDGQMVKVKTKWYMERHRAMTFLRERDIAGAVLNESLDDLKALLVSEGVDISEIEQIEQRTVAGVNHIIHQVEHALAEIKRNRDDKKSAALAYGPKGMNHMYFGLIMRAMDGKEPDVMGWYERNVLPTIPLRQLNLLNSTAEAE